ncbi:hypothetical protein JCM11957_01300 [Caminibacter profundus]
MKSKRLLELLEDLRKGKIICIKKWANSKNISERTLQRYLEEIREFYDIEIKRIKKGCYQVPQFDEINNRLIKKEELEDFEKFANIVAALNPKFLKFLNIDERLLKKIARDKVFYLKESPVEDLMNTKNEFLKKLKSSIKYHKVLAIEYESDKRYFFEEFKPYKIVFADGNWYVAGVSNDNINNGFKFLRINFIKNIIETKKEFKPKKEVKEFIFNFQSLFSRFGITQKEVIVEVDKEAKRFFKVKKFLPSQTILNEDENLLRIRYFVTSDEEIILLAKRWLPHMKIITPAFLQQKLTEIVRKIL